eukprot:Gb_26462 [translate_table: standard]
MSQTSFPGKFLLLGSENQWQKLDTQNNFQKGNSDKDGDLFHLIQQRANPHHMVVSKIVVCRPGPCPQAGLPIYPQEGETRIRNCNLCILTSCNETIHARLR